MPERDKFPKEYFDSNPYESNTPEETYQKIRWGNAPQETFELDAPEAMATIGDVAQLVTTQGKVRFSENEAPFLALGANSNFLYIVPKCAGMPVNIPNGPYTLIATLKRIDYYSDKGGDDAYYYHNHEPPYPNLYMHLSSGVCILCPSECDDGSRSYAVSDEGIIG